jgi:hypothetical protein
MRYRRVVCDRSHTVGLCLSNPTRSFEIVPTGRRNTMRYLLAIIITVLCAVACGSDNRGPGSSNLCSNHKDETSCYGDTSCMWDYTRNMCASNPTMPH